MDTVGWGQNKGEKTPMNIRIDHRLATVSPELARRALEYLLPITTNVGEVVGTQTVNSVPEDHFATAPFIEDFVLTIEWDDPVAGHILETMKRGLVFHVKSLLKTLGDEESRTFTGRLEIKATARYAMP